MIDDHHGWATGRATLLVRAVDGILGTHNGKGLLPLIAAGLDAIERSDLPKTARRELTSLFVDNLIHDAARRDSELLLLLRLAAGASQAR